MNLTYTPVSQVAPRCVSCGAFLPKFDPYQPGYYRQRKRPKKKISGTADDQPPTYGTRGDNICCNSRCGHDLMVKLVKSVPGLIDLLPGEWRMDLKPLETVPKIIAKREAAKEAAKRQRRWRPYHTNK
jgi:hypothetical protein